MKKGTILSYFKSPSIKRKATDFAAIPGSSNSDDAVGMPSTSMEVCDEKRIKESVDLFSGEAISSDISNFVSSQLTDPYETEEIKSLSVSFIDTIEQPKIESKNRDSVTAKEPESLNITFMNDISNFVGVELTSSQKVEKMKSLWKPSSNYCFPIEDAKGFKRHFQCKWLDEYKWLAYSKLQNGLYCKSCVLFLDKSTVGKGSHQKPITFVTKPYYHLKKAVESFKKHQSTEYHKNAVLNENDVAAIVEGKKQCIEKQLDSKKKKDAEDNRLKLDGILETIRFCGMQNIPLRGHSDWGRISLSTPLKNDGNFRSLLRYRAKGGDLILKDHLENSSRNAMYTSPRIQNSLIDCFSHLIQKKIVEQVQESQYYTVLADETTDISQVEQFSLCLRYVTNVKPFMIKENFLTFVPVYDVTGEALAAVIEKKFTEYGLDLANLRGQGYDGASAMRGQFRGVQALLKKKFPKAIYTHCVSHCLNLCLSDSFKVQCVRNAMGVISETCSFFRASAKRTKILEDKIKQEPNCDSCRIKVLCETRWCERHEAVLLFKEMIMPIVSALEHVSDLPGDHSKKASLILNSICTPSFLSALVVASKLLGLTYNLSKSLQKENIDLFNAITQVNATKIVIENLRENATFEFHQLFTEAQRMASRLNVILSIPRISCLQRHRPNPPSTDPEDYYRITVYIPCIEDIISSLTERFLTHQETVSSLHFVIPAFCDVPFEKIRKAVEFYKEDLSYYLEDAFVGEWEIWRQKWRGVEKKPTCAIDGLDGCDRNLFPNVHILLKMLALLPVSTASVERSFSNLKLIKSYLRNTICENRLNGLALLFIHRELALQITNDQVINHFVGSGNARRLQLNI